MPVASHTAKQGKLESTTKHGNSSGAMEEGSRNVRSHVLSLIVVDGAANAVEAANDAPNAGN